MLGLLLYCSAFHVRDERSPGLRGNDRFFDNLFDHHPASIRLFHVLQEALHNAVQHSGVRQFDARLWAASGEIHLAVSDCGVGFNLKMARKAGGLGLNHMRERLKLVKGTLSIDSQAKRGTTIHACIPLRLGSDSIGAAG